MTKRLGLLLVAGPVLWELAHSSFALRESSNAFVATLALLLLVPQAYFTLGPLIAVLVAGAVPLTAPGLSRMLRIAVVSVAALALVDHAVLPVTTEISETMERRYPAAWPDLNGTPPDPYEVRGTGPMLVHALLMPDAEAEPYAPRESREWWIATGVRRAGNYLLVPILIGLLCGAWSLLLGQVVIPDPEDRERLTRLTSWGIAPLAFAILVQWMSELRADVPHGQNPWMTVVPLVATSILAVAGWRSARRFVGTIALTGPVLER